jgi:hypothetical protein
MRDLLWLPRLEQMTDVVEVIKPETQSEFGFPCVKSYSATLFPVLLTYLCWREVRVSPRNRARVFHQVIVRRLHGPVLFHSTTRPFRWACFCLVVGFFPCWHPACILAWRRWPRCLVAQSLPLAPLASGDWYVRRWQTIGRSLCSLCV